MRGLSYLVFAKWKASARNPVFIVTAIVAGALFLIAFAVAVTRQGDNPIPVNLKDMDSGVMIVIGYIAFFYTMMLAQKHNALVYEPDAVYVIGGPFDRKQILAYILVDAVRGCLFYTMVFNFTLLLFAMLYHAPLSFFFWSLVALFLLSYILFSSITWFYLLGITSRSGRWVKVAVLSALSLFAAFLAYRNIAEANFQFREGIVAFLHDPRFFMVPVFGWTKCVLLSSAAGSLAGILTGLSPLLLLSGLLTALIVNIKGDFYEKALEDTEMFTRLRQNARKGEDAEAKISRRTAAASGSRFQTGAGAVMSKSIYQMRRTNSWIRKQDILLVALYLFIAKINRTGFNGFQLLLMIIVFLSISADTMMAELKMPYIYMIPDTPLRKIISVAVPILLREWIVVTVSLAAAGLLFQTAFFDVLMAIIALCGYSTIFVAGNLWSIRLLKANRNALAEQFIKMLIILGGCIPSFVLAFAAALFLNGNPLMPVVSVFITVAVNLLMGLLFIALSKGIFLPGGGMSESI